MNQYSVPSSGSLNFGSSRGDGSNLTEQLKSWNSITGGNSAMPKSVPNGGLNWGGAFSAMGQDNSTPEEFRSFAQPYSVEQAQNYNQQYNNQVINAMKAYYRSIPTSMNYPKVGGR